MEKKTFRIGNASVDYYFGGGMSQLKAITDPKATVVITDENIFGAHEKLLRRWHTIALKAGEQYKVQQTVDSVILQLIELGADRNTTLVGIGGGVITDLTGYIASVFLRGVRFGFVPTSLLALVDASIGGKNGVDVGVYKNMVGTIRQPSFILHDMVFLNSLPHEEWRNGFAEIIKHAAIKGARMFSELEANSLRFYQKKKREICALVQRNALIKTKVVLSDELESGERKLLNFGHTLGHALENQYELSHGEAVAIGMAYAGTISSQLTGFRHAERLNHIIEQYELPTTIPFDKEKVMEVLRKDKKKAGDGVHYILLQRIGKAMIHPITFSQLSQLLP